MLTDQGVFAQRHRGLIPRAMLSQFRASSALARSVAVSERRSRRSTGVLGQGELQRAHVLRPELISGVLAREKKRADRSNRPLVLLLVTMSDEATIDGSVAWDKAIEALVAVKRETDVLGWFEQDAVLGVIFSEIQGSYQDVALALEARFRRELAKRIDMESAGSVPAVQLHVHPDPTPVGERQPSCVARLPEHLNPLEKRPTIYEALKRGLDIVGALVLLMLLSPLMLLVAALVKLTSPGPILFRQVRVGQGMKPFTMLKFRTMHVNNDNALHKEFVSSFIKASRNGQAVAGDGVFKITSDPRVTRIGRMLRKSSIDELPQFWNVVRGDMSLVGPRPPLPYEVEQYERWHCRRVIEAKPGITGLWQVFGRSRTTFDEMVRLDLRYVKTCSLLMDLKILLATPKAVIVGKGAC